MSLQTIAQTLYQQASNGNQVTIDDNLLQTGNTFASLVQTALKRSAGNVILAAVAANIPQQPAGNSFSFPASLPANKTDSFLNLLSNTATVTISVSGAAYQLQLDIQLRSGGTLNWVPSTSFNELLGWPFDTLTITDPEFHFISGDNNLPAGLYEGLNYSAVPALSGYLQPAAAFLKLFGYSNAGLTPLTGLIGATANGINFVWSAGFTGVNSIDLTALSIDALKVKFIFGYAALTQNADPDPWGQVVLAAETRLSGQVDPVDVFFSLPISGQSSSLDLIIAPAPGTLSTSLSSLGNWMIGKSWDQFFAQAPANQLLPFLNNFGLRSYSCSFGLSKFSILSTTISVGTLAPWTIRPNLLVVTDFELRWQLLDPLQAAYSSVSINGTLDMISATGQHITFKGSIQLPNLMLSFGLYSKETLTGAEWLQTVVTAFGAGAVDQYILDALANFSLSTVQLNIDVPQEDYTFQLIGTLNVGEKPVGFNVYLHLNLLAGLAYDIKVSFAFGSMIVMGEITNANAQKHTVISAGWANETNPIGLETIANALGYPDLGIPPEMDLALKEISVTYDITASTLLVSAASQHYGSAVIALLKPTGAASYVLFGGYKIDQPISLTNLPLVGKALSNLETVSISKLQILLSSGILSATDQSSLNDFIRSQDNNLPQIPSMGMAATVSFSMEFDIGGYLIPIGTGIGGTSTTPGLPPGKSSVQGTPSGNTAAPVPSTSGAVSDGVSWFNLQKAVGPVMFNRIGIQYKDGVLWFLLDAGFSSGGLHIDLLGAGIGSPITSFVPEFRIDGLGLDFSSPGFELGGSFMRVPPGPGVDWEYAGGAIIKAGNFSLSAVGSYASLSGTPSMFVFGQVTGTFGGPPPFFVTGFAGGFGYNSRLRLPNMNEVYQFPLVAGAQNPAVIGGKSPSPAAVLALLLGRSGSPAWVTHEVGQYWFAAGIQFSTYTIVNSNALLVIEFGKQLQFALLGLSRARFPMAGPVTYAFLELQIQVIVDPDIGAFQLAAILSPNSFVLDPSCKLTGGFAFYMWFSPNTHAGDFAVTVGGYHPSFDPPDWYPQVPRVGFTWSLDSTISITGGAYFAMTPSAAMAGGRLSATYQSGKLKAWFTAWADMLVFWNPFQFDVYIGISIGASYQVDLLFTTSTLEVELGASLHLWGPPTGGSVTVHWWVISFTIDFGKPQTKEIKKIKWPDFQTQLPAKESIIKFLPGEGLAPNGQTDLNSNSPWIARPAGFQFITQSAIPSSTLYLGSAKVVIASADLINIRPMQETGLTSTLQLIITRNGNEIDYSTEQWQVHSQQQSIAKAMWGKGPKEQLDAGDDQLVKNQLMGFSVIAPDPDLGPSPGAINVKQNLGFIPLDPLGQLPIQPNENAKGPLAITSTQTIALIEQQIADPAYVNKRTDLFNALKLEGLDLKENSDMHTYADYAGALFVEEPLLIPQN